MSLLVSPEDSSLALREIPLSDRLSSYITTLTQSASGTFVFRTGAGRILCDLLLHWPTLDKWEPEAQELCQRITDAVYPLVSATFARGVEITATIASTPIHPPDRVDAMSTYVLFNPASHIERQCFLSPRHALPSAQIMSVPQGVVILCRPLHYRYHTIKDDRKRIGHPHTGIFELCQRLINELYERPLFVPREKLFIDTLKTKIHDLVKMSAQADAARTAYQSPPKTEASRTTRQPPPKPEPLSASQAIWTASRMSSIPAVAQALIRLLMLYVMNKGFSPDLKLELRRIAQSLRALYPLGLIENAARAETMSPHINPSTHTVHSFRRADLKIAEQAVYNRAPFPKAIPDTRTGALNKTIFPQPAPFSE